MSRNHLFLLIICIPHFLKAQKNEYKVPDSLRSKSYQYLDDKIYEFKKDSSKASVYLYTYLTKAKKERNWEEIVNSFHNFSHHSRDHQSIAYSDSMVYYAKKSNDNALVGSAYLTKGIMHYSLKQQNYALDNYIIANNYISKTEDAYLTNKLKYHVALVKYYLGYYDEAISLLRQCTAYFKNEHPRAYLNSLHSLGLCYSKAGNLGLCSETNILGLAECKDLDILEMEVYFNHSQGINEYFKHNYSAAIKNIESSIKDLKEKKDFGNESVGYFYIGKSYWEVKKYEKAIPYFQKVDQIFNYKGYIRPDQREFYELLIKYYKNKDNQELQLYYVDQLLKADAVLNETFKYLVGKINKEYNTKSLLTEKEKLQAQLHKKNYDYSIVIGVSLLLFILLMTLTYRFFRNKKLNKQKFDELMQRINTAENRVKPKEKIAKKSILDINPETVAAILLQLDKFENEKKFLEGDWSISKLSTSFNSNPTYLSSIIRYYRDKGFTEYINDLKIEHIILLLKADKRVRNYTNKALAEEAGFSSTQLFSNVFRAKTGVTTAYFIQQIKIKVDNK